MIENGRWLSQNIDVLLPVLVLANQRFDRVAVEEHGFRYVFVSGSPFLSFPNPNLPTPLPPGETDPQAISLEDLCA